MVIKHYIKKNGIGVTCDKMGTWQKVQIGFLNSDGVEDETEFDLMYAATSSGITELCNLFRDFCIENGYSQSHVLYVTIVAGFDTLEDLLAAG